MPRQRVHVEIAGLISVHAVRAVQTALTGVPGLLETEVSLRGATLETTTDGDPTHVPPAFRQALEDALALAGVEVISVRAERAGLPVV